VAPRTEEERKLCELWQAILKVERVGIHDDFFALGGHSLLATQLISAIRQEFAIEFPLRALFEMPTIAALSPTFKASQENYSAPFSIPAETKPDFEEYEF
jgi:acyl carrier protein